MAGDALVPLALFLNGIPYFWLGLLVLYLFGLVLGWFPIANAYSTTHQLTGFAQAASIVYHAVLPAVTIIVSAAGGWLLTMRNAHEIRYQEIALDGQKCPSRRI